LPVGVDGNTDLAASVGQSPMAADDQTD